MTIEVFVGGWEHECCGPEIVVNQVVTWDLSVDDDGHFWETHHLPEDVARTVTGRVTDIRAIDGDRDPEDAGRVVARDGEHTYLVTLSA